MERKTITLAESNELHDMIPNRINSIVKLNMEFDPEKPTLMHNRECLDGVIADLQMWRDTLPTIQDLIDQGVL
jgi:hypothetical protein